MASQGFSVLSPRPTKVNISKGVHDVVIDSEYPYNSLQTNTIEYFKENPTGFALNITRNYSESILREGSTKEESWRDNPVGVGAILIPPPCPRKVRGKGVVSKIIVIDNGNPGISTAALNIDRPTGDTPSVPLGTPLPDGGIPGGDVPPGGAGGGTDVPPGGVSPSNIPDIPNINIQFIPVLRVPTGANARFMPQFEVIRETLRLPPQKLLQVTDLVGLKQTGYVNGRAYYGSVYYDNGVRYAGFYKTAGEPIIVYDTLRESILAQVTTPPSAILRQGTDIRSNNPLLNIPGTVQSTLSSTSIVGSGDYFPPSFVPDPGQITYDVALILSSVLVLDPGINYNETDQIRVTPNNGAVLKPIFGSFGRVVAVKVLNPGLGFTEYTKIEMYTPE